MGVSRLVKPSDWDKVLRYAEQNGWDELETRRCLGLSYYQFKSLLNQDKSELGKRWNIRGTPRGVKAKITEVEGWEECLDVAEAEQLTISEVCRRLEITPYYFHKFLENEEKIRGKSRNLMTPKHTTIKKEKPENWYEVMERYERGEISARKARKIMRLTQGCYDRFIREDVELWGKVWLKPYTMRPDNFEAIMLEVEAGDISLKEAWKAWGIGSKSFFKCIEDDRQAGKVWMIPRYIKPSNWVDVMTKVEQLELAPVEAIKELGVTPNYFMGVLKEEKELRGKDWKLPKDAFIPVRPRQPPYNFEELKQGIRKKELTKAKAAKLSGVSYSTFARFLAEDTKTNKKERGN